MPFPSSTATTRPDHRCHNAFTLVELITVIVIISVLGLLLFPVLGAIQGKAEKLNCTSNLKSLHSGVQGYMTDHKEWPQIYMTKADDKVYAKAWLNALKKYGIQQDSWICPTTQRGLGAPDMSDPANLRLDYLATPFDNHPSTPFKWSTQPWFVEKGAPHGNGNLLIYKTGSVEELANVRVVH